jgi:NAD(P)-dependent dehydrogenase (short-subunit alcohol dehydrogenase family)
VANSRDIKPSKDPNVLTVEGDVSRQDAADQIIGQALDRFGRVDTLVNNAGVFIAKPFTDYTAADYASIAEHADSVEPTALTALTKGGLAAVTRSLAVEYASRGIRVNAVAPGIVQTAVHPAESYTPAALAGKLPPLGHVGQISDVVDGILYLESAPYVTGEVLHIDGGRTAGR